MFFYIWKYDRLFPIVKNILNKEDILYVRRVKHAARGPYVVCGHHGNTNVTHMALGGPSVWHAWRTIHSNTLQVYLERAKWLHNTTARWQAGGTNHWWEHVEACLAAVRLSYWHLQNNEGCSHRAFVSWFILVNKLRHLHYLCVKLYLILIINK
jgi:hypothetical protein